MTVADAAKMFWHAIASVSRQRSAPGYGTAMHRQALVPQTEISLNLAVGETLVETGAVTQATR